MGSKISKNISAKSGKLKDSGNLKKTKKNEFNQEQTAKTRVNRAKKMVLRKPNKEIMQATERLKKIRSDINEPVRLQKALAMAGVASRRSAEELIAAGLVEVNGKVASLGSKVIPTDEVKVKGKIVRLVWQNKLPRIILYYKQEGEIVTRKDPQGRVSVFDRLQQTANSRWVAIGRLDINTAGLLIFTTSGEMANRFAHPSFAIDREYRVRISGELTDEQMRQLTTDGIKLDDGIAKAARITAYDSDGKNHRYDIVVQEGRNREVRRIFEYFGFQISKLTRVRFGPIGIPPRLKRGQFYELNEVEVAYVMKEMGMDIPKMNYRRNKK